MAEKDLGPSEETPELDLELLRYNLELSHEERLIEHQRALQLLFDLQEAGKDYYAKQSE